MGLTAIYADVEAPNQNKHRDIQPWSSGLRRQEGNFSPEMPIYVRISIWFFCFDNKLISIVQCVFNLFIIIWELTLPDYQDLLMGKQVSHPS